MLPNFIQCLMVSRRYKCLDTDSNILPVCFLMEMKIRTFGKSFEVGKTSALGVQEEKNWFHWYQKINGITKK